MPLATAKNVLTFEGFPLVSCFADGTGIARKSPQWDFVTLYHTCTNKPMYNTDILDRGVHVVRHPESFLRF